MIKKLARSIREFKTNAILSPIFITVEVAFDILIPFVMNYLLKEGIMAGNVKLTLIYGGVLILMALAALLFGVLSGVHCSIASCGFAKNLRKDMYSNIQDYSFSNIDKFSSSSLITRMTTDVTYVQNAFQMIIRIAVRCPLMFVFAIVMTMIINGPIATVYLIVIPLLVISLFFVFKGAFKVFKKLFKRYDRLNNVVEENIRGMRIVKSNNRENFENEKFQEVSENIYKDFSKAQKLIALSNPLMQLAMYACIIAISYISAKIIISSGGVVMDVSDLQTLITYTTQVLMSLMMLSMVFGMITVSKASAERICAVLDEQGSIKNCEKPCYSVANGEIAFKNVNFSYNGDDKFALKNTCINIASGETIGIIGGTGSAKTTLVQLIPRIYDVSSGVVEVGGKDVREYDLTTLRKSVAMVLQKNVLFSGTLRENMKWGDENASDEEIISALKLACAWEFVSTFEDGLDHKIEQGGSNVSGGQKQRLCIARALIAKPKVLIMDDSTSAVDVKTDSKIRTSLKELAPEMTKIIIAQRISSVMDADRIYVMDGGEIIGVGNHEELLKSCDIYNEVYTSQIGGGDFDASKNN